MALVWSLQLRLAFSDNTNQELLAVKQFDTLQVIGGTIEEFNIISGLAELNDFLTRLGFGSTATDFPSNLNSYEYRFSALSTNGSIDVLGSNKDLEAAGEEVSNNFDAIVADLAADSDFLTLMGASDDTSTSTSSTSSSTSTTSGSLSSSTSTSSSTSSTSTTSGSLSSDTSSSSTSSSSSSSGP